MLYTHAGPEISVASTKAFTTQLTALYLLASSWEINGKSRASTDARKLLRDLMHLPTWIEELWRLKTRSRNWRASCMPCLRFSLSRPRHQLSDRPRGALKLKEISYIHAEGYPAGEMKHGPIALIDEKMPVVVLAPRDRYFEKTISNLKEVESRGGRSSCSPTMPRPQLKWPAIGS